MTTREQMRKRKRKEREREVEAIKNILSIIMIWIILILSMFVEPFCAWLESVGIW